jgi:hypothetical protein
MMSSSIRQQYEVLYLLDYPRSSRKQKTLRQPLGRQGRAYLAPPNCKCDADSAMKESTGSGGIKLMSGSSKGFNITCSVRAI